MCWQCDHPGATTADYLQELRLTIRKHRWAVQYVEDEKKRMEIGGDVRLEFVKVGRPDAHLKFAIALYGPDVQALQLVWRDAHGHSPWCPDFDGGRGTQPVLGKRGPQNA